MGCYAAARSGRWRSDPATTVIRVPAATTSTAARSHRGGVTSGDGSSGRAQIRSARRCPTGASAGDVQSMIAIGFPTHAAAQRRDDVQTAAIGSSGDITAVGLAGFRRTANASAMGGGETSSPAAARRSQRRR
jgi:hypothetical protein